MLRRRMIPAVFASVVVLAGCGDESDPIASPSRADPSPTSSAADPIPVLASTDVYGDIARQVGGDRVDVTSIISGESQDPHSYEATARDQLAVSKARVVITNGGHYDEFMSRLLSAAGGDRTVLTAVDIAEEHEDDDSTSTPEASSSASASGSASASASEATASPSTAEDEHAEDEHADDEHAEDEHAEDEHAEDEHADDEHADDEHADDEHADDEHADDEHADDEHADDEDGHAHGSGENEHVWYDLAAMDAVAEELVDALGDLEPDSRSEFEQNYETFSEAIEALQQKQADIRAEHEGEDVAVTEIVAGWLLADCGLENRTPAEFSEAIEESTDVPVRVLQETLALMADDAVKVLIYNEQTTGPQTDQLRDAAEDAGLPIVNVRETLPEGSDYLEWMDNTLNALRDALT